MKGSRLGKVAIGAGGVLACVALAACGGEESRIGGPVTPTSVGPAKVFFTDPDDGSSVTSPVEVGMDAQRFDIELAGPVVPGSGHFHVMVNVACVAPGETIPEDDGHLHFGKAQRRAELVLPPGEHTLCLQAGDGAHTALDLTDQVKLTVTVTG